MAWPIIEPLFRAIAAPSPDGNGQCVSWIGKGGSGHFVKMVHNGIEYADMQLIAESYGYIASHLGMTPDECAVVFEQWNTTELSSYLIGITADICRKADDRGVGPLLDRVSDRVSQKGTGIWTSQMSLELGIPVPTITEAVNARFMSANATHSNHKVVSPATTYSAHEKQEKLEKLRVSLYLSKIVSYSQGFALISKANEVYGWDIHPSDLSRIWQAGCIIRARVLTIITESLITYPDTTHLFESPLFVEALRSGIPVWRTLIAETITSGMPLPGMTSALLYVDSLKASYRSSHLIALQRDYFGSHGYERTDMSGVFHTDWS